MNEETPICIGLPLHCMVRAPVLTVDELAASIGVVRKTPPFQLDVADNRKFCESTYLDVAYPESSSESVYEEDLVEGFYLVSLMDVLKKCTYHDDQRYYGLNYGSNRLRFIEKVLSSDVLTFHTSVATVKPKGNGFLIEVNCELWVVGQYRPAVLYSMIYMLLPV